MVDGANPHAADLIARALGFEDVEHAARIAREEELSRLLACARRDADALLLYHQTSPQRAARIQEEGFRLAKGEEVEAVCFTLEPEQTGMLATYAGALITVRLPISWLAEAEFHVNPSWNSIELLQDVPAMYIIGIECFPPAHQTICQQCGRPHASEPLLEVIGNHLCPSCAGGFYVQQPEE